MSEIIAQDSSEKPAEKTYAEKFAEERAEWTMRSNLIAAKFKKVEDLAEVQVELYSNRQIAIEYLFKLIGIHSMIKKLTLEAWKKAYDDFEKQDLRYSEKERMKMSDNATGAMRYRGEIISSHIEFFRETIKTIDNMIFGVKHRIEIENFKAGIK